MARKKKEEEVVEVEETETEQEEIQDEALTEEVEEEAPVVEKTVVAKKPDGTPAYTKAQFKEIIEAYKVQNPVKYEMKKEALQKQLNALK